MRFDTTDSVMHDQLDFVPRERRSRIARLVMVFAVAILLVFLLAYVPLLPRMDGYAPLVAIIVLALLCLYSVYYLQLALDTTTATEFQNLLFAQALNIGASAFILVRRDGSIVHANEGFTQLFPGSEHAQSQALDSVFEAGTVRKTDRERVMAAIYSNTSERLIFSLPKPYQPAQEYILTVEPLERPAGFSLVRAREYLGKRAGLQPLPDTLRATSIDKLDHLLATSNIALFTTDGFGRFEYVNPSFERLCGYESGEVVDGKLSLHHVFFSMGTTTITEEYTVGDYTGEAVIITKQSQRHTVGLRQSVVRDGNKKPVGATGSFALMAPRPV